MLEFLGPNGAVPAEAHIDVATGMKVGLAVAAVVAGLVGIAYAAQVFLREARADRAELLARGWRYDETISAFMGGPGRKGFEELTVADQKIVDGAVNGVGGPGPRPSGRSSAWPRPATSATTPSASPSAP